MLKVDLRDRLVLVTGASSGLGREMARHLAREYRAHPILVARRKDRLEELAEELRGLGVRPTVLAADLTQPADLDRVFEESTASRELHAVILNAGVTYFGEFLEQPPANIETLMATNVTSVVRLTQRYLPYLLEHRRRGGLLLVSSTAGFQPMPYQAVYGGTKAFITSFAEAVTAELRGRPATISVFCPGGIATEMTETSGLSRKYGKDHPMVMDAAECARQALQAFAAGKRIHVPGALNKVAAAASALAPRSLVTRLLANDYRDALKKT